jgi:hypothetical protein
MGSQAKQVFRYAVYSTVFELRLDPVTDHNPPFQ